MTRTAALRQFLEAIGRRDGFIPPAADAMRETYDMYRLDAALTPAQLGALTAAHCLALHEVFGAALELRVTGQFGSIAIRGDRLLTTPDGSADPEGIVLTAATGSAANAAIAAALAEMADDDAALDLALDKGLLAADLARERGWVNQAHVVYYFSLDALVALIDAEGLPTLDRLFFAAEARPTVVVVGEGNTLLYRGDLLAITAEARLSNLGSLEHLIRLSPDAMLLEKYRHAGRDHLALNAPLRHLTPAHLICTPEEGGIGALTGALRRGLFHLAVLYTANRATQSESAREGVPNSLRYVASYHERRQTARLALRANDEITLPDAVLADFALWPFGGEGRSDDRLAMLQRTLAQALPGTADENTVALLAALPILLAETKAQYEVFIDDQLDEYAKQRQGVADYAAEVAKKIADSVEAVTKGLVDTSLATIAAVAAVVLAAVTNDKLRGTAFSAILWIYAAYVYVQALYRLLSATHSAILLRLERLRGGYIVLHGPPGSGKTTALMLYAEGHADGRGLAVAQYYCFHPRDPYPARRLTGSTFLQSLVTSLQERFPQLFTDQRPFDHTGGRLDAMLQTVGRHASELGKVAVVTIDGLDHAWRGGTAQDSVFDALPTTPPDNVVFLVSVQTPDQLPERLRPPRSETERYLPIDRFDLWRTHDYVALRLEAAGAVDDGQDLLRPGGVAALRQRADGLPLYLHYLVDLWLRERPVDLIRFLE